jgi:hypothetical protein
MAWTFPMSAVETGAMGTVTLTLTQNLAALLAPGSSATATEMMTHHSALPPGAA